MNAKMIKTQNAAYMGFYASGAEGINITICAANMSSPLSDYYQQTNK
jgi:hypothetical protein